VVRSSPMITSMFITLLLLSQGAGGPPRNTWPAQYAKADAATFAAEFEEPSRALFRYRAAMSGLMQVKPGMTVGEVGAGSGSFARHLVEKVGPQGQVFANELEPKMVAYMKDRAAKEGLTNFTAVQGTATSTGFQAGTLDAVAAVYAFSFFDQPDAMLKSMNEALKPGGVMLIVDIPSEQVGAAIVGAEVDDVLARAAAAGFTRLGENAVVPGHYALIFRKGPAPEKKEAVR
jgi:ubiquinone/menaquinone biosynthesis C-methylase UbiE